MLNLSASSLWPLCVAPAYTCIFASVLSSVGRLGGLMYVHVGAVGGL